MSDVLTDAIPAEPLGSYVLELQVADVIAETDDVISLVFTVPIGPDGPTIPPERLRYAPGQFLTLRIPSDRTGSVARCYSLSSSPFTDDALAITVKRTADGYASNWLCDHAYPGMRIHVLAPSGNFVPKTLDGDFFMLAAGSGITPIISICKSALTQGGGQVTVFYANQDERRVIFADTLRELAARYPSRLTVIHWLESLQGRPSVAALTKLVAPYRNCPTFICGPGPFMDVARATLNTLEVPVAQIHQEVFRSLETDPFAAVTIAHADGEKPATAAVTLDGATHTVSWARGAKLLDVLLTAGLSAPFSCREGHCGACACTMRSGKVRMDVNDVLEQQDLDDGLILACQAYPESDSVEVTYDE